MVVASRIAREHFGLALAFSFLIVENAAALSSFCYVELASHCLSTKSSHHCSYICVGEGLAWIIGWASILEFTIGGSTVARGAVTALCSTLMAHSCLRNHVLKPRFLMAMAGDGLLRSFFSDVNKRTPVPYQRAQFWYSCCHLSIFQGCEAVCRHVSILRYVPPDEVLLPSLQATIYSVSLRDMQDMLVKTSEKQAIWKRTVDSILDTFNLVNNVVCKIKLLTSLDMIEHDGRAFIYGVLVSVDTNDILTNDKFPVLDIGKEFILVNDTRVRVILTKLRDGDIIFDVEDVWNETLIEDVFLLRWSEEIK
ncbi:hypothetical protein Tco_1212700 [Tanacetum coccineum]